jgi:hypothetical protein
MRLSETVNQRRPDNTINKRKSATYQLMIYKILHKNNNIRPPAPPLLGKTGMKSGAIE